MAKILRSSLTWPTLHISVSGTLARASGARTNLSTGQPGKPSRSMPFRVARCPVAQAPNDRPVCLVATELTRDVCVLSKSSSSFACKLAWAAPSVTPAKMPPAVASHSTSGTSGSANTNSTAGSSFLLLLRLQRRRSSHCKTWPELSRKFGQLSEEHVAVGPPQGCPTVVGPAEGALARCEAWQARVKA